MQLQLMADGSGRAEFFSGIASDKVPVILLIALKKDYHQKRSRRQEGVLFRKGGGLGTREMG